MQPSYGSTPGPVPQYDPMGRGRRFGSPRPGPVLPAIPTATRLVKVPSLVSLAAGATGTPQTIEWQQDGAVVGLLGAPLSSGAGAYYGSLSFQLRINDSNEEVISDGTGAAFITLASLVGTIGEPIPFFRRVYAHQKWTITFKNFHATDAITPELCFWFLADKDAQAYPLGGEIHTLPAPTRFILVPNEASLAASSISTGQFVEWMQDGEVTHMLGCNRGTGSTSEAGVRITLTDTLEELFTDGQSGTHICMASIFGAGSTNVFPLQRRVYAHQKWSVQYRNFHSGFAITPQLAFGLRADKDLLGLLR